MYVGEKSLEHTTVCIAPHGINWEKYFLLAVTITVQNDCTSTVTVNSSTMTFGQWVANQEFSDVRVDPDASNSGEVSFKPICDKLA